MKVKILKVIEAKNDSKDGDKAQAMIPIISTIAKNTFDRINPRIPYNARK